MNFFYLVGSQYAIIGHAWSEQTVVDCSGCIKPENRDSSKTWVISGKLIDISFRGIIY